MDQRARSELNSIIRQLDSVVRDLNEQANALNSIKGVGAEICARKLRDAAQKYRNARWALDRL